MYMKVVTAVVNNPTFIELQFLSLKKYMPCEFEYIVFNDAKDFPDFTNGGDVTVKNQIEEVCKKYNIPCINVPNQHHVIYDIPSDRTAQSMNIIASFQAQYPDEYLLMDSDMFLIRSPDIQKFRRYQCAVVLQYRKVGGIDVHYFWNGLYYFNVPKMNNFRLMKWNMLNQCDTGAMTFFWLKEFLKNNPEEILDKNSEKNKIYYFVDILGSGSWNEENAPDYVKQTPKLLQFLQNDPRNRNGKFFCEVYDNSVFHYRAGGNWCGEGKEFHDKLTQQLREVLISSMSV